MNLKNLKFIVSKLIVNSREISMKQLRRPRLYQLYCWTHRGNFKLSNLPRVAPQSSEDIAGPTSVTFIHFHCDFINRQYRNIIQETAYVLLIAKALLCLSIEIFFELGGLRSLV